MSNLRRRIAALEKSQSGARDEFRAAAHDALSWMGAREVELLISACGAERGGRPLTDEELAARDVYVATARRETFSEAGPSADHWLAALDLEQVIRIALAKSMDLEDLELARSGLLSSAQGRTPSEQEASALRACTLERARLWVLAGFSASAEAQHEGRSQ